MARVRWVLLKRAVFLLVAGFLLVTIWPADILHFYGVYIAVGALLLGASARVLWSTALASVVMFVVLLLVGDYGAEWNWQTFDYAGFWTAKGLLKHLFFNGFHPVFPWLAFLLVGLWLGRLDLHDRPVRRRLAVSATIAWASAELLTWGALRLALSGPVARGGDEQTYRALLGTGPMPPMPQYLVSASGTAILTIILIVVVCENDRVARMLAPLAATGRLALSHYVGHVILGLGALEAMGRMEGQTIEFALGAVAAYCLFAVVFSWLWTRRFERGPLEAMMRWLT